MRHVVPDHRAAIVGDQVELAHAHVGDQAHHPGRQRRIGVVDPGGLFGLTEGRDVQADHETVA